MTKNANDAALTALLAMGSDRKDKGGHAYIIHLADVAAAVAANYHLFGDVGATLDEMVQAAFLHDTVEDSPVTLEQLRAGGYSERVLRMVDALTRREGENYLDYAMRVLEDPAAAQIKVADILHNSNVRRLGRELTGKERATMHTRMLTLEIFRATSPEEIGGAALALTAHLLVTGEIPPDEMVRMARCVFASCANAMGVPPGRTPEALEAQARLSALLVVEQQGANERAEGAARRHLLA